jgi:hypothetical protein
MSDFRSLGSLLDDIMDDLQSGDGGHEPGCRQHPAAVFYDTVHYRYDDYEDRANTRSGRRPEPPIYMYDIWMEEGGV